MDQPPLVECYCLEPCVLDHKLMKKGHFYIRPYTANRMVESICFLIIFLGRNLLYLTINFGPVCQDDFDFAIFSFNLGFESNFIVDHLIIKSFELYKKDFHSNISQQKWFQNWLCILFLIIIKDTALKCHQVFDPVRQNLSNVWAKPSAVPFPSFSDDSVAPLL
jgi:hypothetical protein